MLISAILAIKIVCEEKNIIFNHSLTMCQKMNVMREHVYKLAMRPKIWNVTRKLV